MKTIVIALLTVLIFPTLGQAGIGLAGLRSTFTIDLLVPGREPRLAVSKSIQTTTLNPHLEKRKIILSQPSHTTPNTQLRITSQ